MTSRVVITGMGTINPLGKDVSETWGNLVNGVSGVGSITLFDASELLAQIACEVKDFNPEDYMEVKEARRIDRLQQFALVAAGQALDQSGFDISKSDPARIGIIVSTAVGGMTSLGVGVDMLQERGPRRISPFFIPMFMPNAASGLISIHIGSTGPSFSVASACASGSDSIGLGSRLIQAGEIDVCIAGAAEATITLIAIAAFDRLGALSRKNDDFSQTPAPFDAERDGLVMGEGAGVLIIESLEHATARGANIIAELVGHGSTSDAFHITAPSELGVGGATAIRQALDSAGVGPEAVGYINAHGTATELNDVAETQAIKAVFGDQAYQVPISSTKSMTGHMMGATGALEAIICVQVIREGIVPPTIHLQNPDPQCDLDYVPNEARPADVDLAISNAFGFGGHNAVLAIRAFSD